MVEFVAAAELEFGVKMLITSTHRDAESQDALYAIGRRGRPGERIVTNAKGGESWHNHRCAMDAVPLINGIPQWENTELLTAIGRKAQAFGLTWGGDWDGDGEKDRADWDLVHFQWTGGLTIAQLQAGQEIPYA